MSKVLVVYYSRTGHTRAAASRIAHALRADLEVILEERDRVGTLGFLRSTIDAVLDRDAELLPRRHDPSRYDLVVLCAPIWAGKLATPARTWLAKNGVDLPYLAVALTCGGRGQDRVLQGIEDMLGVGICARTAITDHDRAHGDDAAKLDRFVIAARSVLHRLMVPEAAE